MPARTIKHRPSPSKVEHRGQEFESLLVALGMNDDHFARYAVAQDLEHIERQWVRWTSASDKLPSIKFVHTYRAAITKVLKLSEGIGPDFLANEIDMAGWARNIPDADEQTLHALRVDHEDRRRNALALLREHGLDVDHWLKINSDTYKKRHLRRLVIEPFFRLMAKHEITTDRWRLPRVEVFFLLFNWLGIESKFRPSSANIDAIARELEGSAGASMPNAKRRTEK